MNVDFSIWPTVSALMGRSAAIAGAMKNEVMNEKQGVVFNALDMTISCLALKTLNKFGMEINATNLFLSRMIGFTTSFVITTLTLGEFSISVAAAMSVSSVAWGYILAPTNNMAHFFLNNPL
ncbi:MAG: hypothetical protein H0V82_06520 [Candidatus Protochlamydia sp.]|nr:hypothetical protein [Candidatus Protochlamydia sp.]